MWRRWLGTLSMTTVLICACTAQKGPDAPHSSASPSRRVLPPANAVVRPAEFRMQAAAIAGGDVAAPPPAVEPTSDGQATDRDAAQLPVERKLVRRGEMTIEVRSVNTALEKIEQIVSSMGGHTTNRSEEQNEYGRRSASVTCRIPVDRLDRAVEAVKALGVPRALTLTAEDITTAYFDVAVRISTQTQLEHQLVSLLRRPTNKLSELLEIERELARVREEIDRLEGRKRSWDNQVALSSLQITIEDPMPVVAGTGGGLWHTLGQSISESTENFVLAVAGIIATAGSILPMAILVGGAAWVAVRRWRRRHTAPAPAV
jgi:hypothetical protein